MYQKVRQILNGFAEYYYLTEEGTVYNSKANKYLQKSNCYKLKLEDNGYKKISLKKLYQMVFNENYCIDNIIDLPGEVWQEIPGTNKMYYASTEGRIKSCMGYEAAIMKPWKNDKGYLRVELQVNNNRVNKLVSHLVAATFLIQPKEIDMQLHHKDTNKQNNRVSNLEWLTPQQHREEHKKIDAAREAARKEK